MSNLMNNLSLDIARLHAAYADGLLPVDVIDEAYRRIEEAGDPGIFIALADRQAARNAAESLGAFDPAAKPLWGVPFAVKDNIDVAGMPTTAACPEFAYLPEANAACVDLLLQAGAILIGKTNLDQFATGLVGVRTPYPVPRNAIDADLVPGGSSSGSAVAVARGLVSFALGTDTAGSGRVPAALNNIVGLKPSLGAISTRGVVPACRTLDCVSIFVQTVDDAWRVLKAAADYDAQDPYSRPIRLGGMQAAPKPRIGIPAPGSLEFFGDQIAAKAFETHLAVLEQQGAWLAEIDLEPFREIAELLYSGPWVAERYQAIRGFIEARPEALHPVTRRIIGSAEAISAADAFGGFYKLAELRRRIEPIWREIDLLAVPSIPTVYTCAEVEADPVGANSRLGAYTNFVNLLDLCALAVPGSFREDGRAAGLTLIAPRGADGMLARLGEAFHYRSATALGAAGLALPSQPERPASAPQDMIELAVVGAHMSGLPLNGELTSRGGIFLREAVTLPCYRLYALPGGPPARPGLLRMAGDEAGAAIALEVWALPLDAFGAFMAGIPQPLSIGTLLLADGTTPKGFLVEASGIAGATDVSGFGGWRRYLASRTEPVS